MTRGRDDFLSQYRRSPGRDAAAAGPERDRSIERNGIPAVFASLDQGTALMLDLVFRSGDRLALPYTYLAAVKYERAKGITLEYADRMVTVTGRSLLPIYKGIRSHTATELREGESAFAVGEDEPLIEQIQLSVREG